MNDVMKDKVLAKLSDAMGRHKEDHDEAIFEVCPSCENSRWNMNVNIEKNVFHCWACDYAGTIYKLFRDLKLSFDFDIAFTKNEPKVEQNENDDAVLPEDTVEIKDSPSRQVIIKYLKSRGMVESDIEKYNIMWCPLTGRILFAFYNPMGDLIFWNARTIYKDVKPKYIHAAVSKKTRILKYDGESKEIFLVEGVFDAIAVNKLGKSVIMLMGSSVSEDLKAYLRLKKQSVVICLDSDMTDKQAKLEKDLKSYLGESLVSSLYISGEDASASGIDGDVGLLGYIKRKMK